MKEFLQLVRCLEDCSIPIRNRQKPDAVMSKIDGIVSDVKSLCKSDTSVEG